MRIGIFTDSYFPQVSGVATSIQTLKEELEEHGHEVIIFTTTDPMAKKFEKNIIRFPSIPFFSFKDRRVAFRGMLSALKISKELKLDLVHTHTEFSLGLTGKYVARQLGIPCVHTYHTMYEDYLHYVAKGKVLRPSHVKLISKYFCNQTAGVIAPSEKAKNKLISYGVTRSIKVIPTGVNLKKLSAKSMRDIRYELAISEDELVLLSLSRLAQEKNIQAILHAFPKVLTEYPTAKLIVVGDGPIRGALEQLSKELKIDQSIRFTGEVNVNEVNAYYQASDLYVNASTSESQGLTYIEAIAAGTDIVAKSSSYTDMLIYSGKLGKTYEKDEELAQTILEYLANIKKQETTVTERKILLNSISATVFGEEVLQYYKEAMHVYHQEKMLDPKVYRKSVRRG
ncbi:glycosyltransferase family 4 protein [Desemzia sp. RIT804]|uniref:glycosyltransferase family 4 protein n=1 Tax=Desemzia sp. RIT 804 TaxID=2810209 RepID=UPI0019520C09|nr:glycosyltransferase family 4 protein [Desemzia sp. RIT 804]MBM6613479.1 glycosyltransferase family 4 protein [Desemzia sp. RIT 804]